MSDSITVTCSLCGFLGTFFITPQQHREGALIRAEKLKTGHHCPDDPMRTSASVVTVDV